MCVGSERLPGSGGGNRPAHSTDVVDLKLQHDGIHAAHSNSEDVSTWHGHSSEAGTACNYWHASLIELVFLHL
jgi:hypothetical protein